MARLPAKCGEAIPEGLSFELSSGKDFMCWIGFRSIEPLGVKEPLALCLGGRLPESAASDVRNENQDLHSACLPGVPDLQAAGFVCATANLVRLDTKGRSLDLLVAPKELKARRAVWRPPEPHLPVVTANCSLRARHSGGRETRFRSSSASRGSLADPEAHSRKETIPFSGHTNGGYPQLDHARRNLRRCLPNCRRYAQKHEQRR